MRIGISIQWGEKTNQRQGLTSVVPLKIRQQIDGCFVEITMYSLVCVRDPLKMLFGIIPVVSVPRSMRLTPYLLLQQHTSCVNLFYSQTSFDV